MPPRRARDWVYWVTVPGIVAASAAPAWATVYLTVAQAQQVIFPDERMTVMPLTLTDAQCRAIKQVTGISVRIKEPRVWRVEGGGWFIVDEVLGKHEFITYAIGLEVDGAVRQIEIMDYRETYGGEIREADWRRQFVGKTGRSALKLDGDIKNISGATLSCRHITDGLKRVLAMYDVALR